MRAKPLVVLYSCCNELQRVEHGVERMADERVSRVIEWSTVMMSRLRSESRRAVESNEKDGRFPVKVFVLLQLCHSCTWEKNEITHYPFEMTAPAAPCIIPNTSCRPL